MGRSGRPLMEIQLSATTLFLVLALVALVVGSIAIGRLREARERSTALERELTSTREAYGQARRLKSEVDSLTALIHELPALLQPLHGHLRPRELPPALLDIMLHIFAPRAALVLVRRKHQLTGQPGSDRLVVAAAGPAGCPVETGTTVAFDEGALGFVASAQRAVTRRDLEAQGGLSQRRGRRGNLPGFETDLAAPMEMDGETLGVLAVSEPRQSLSQAPHQKAVLGLVARLGALALRDAQAFSEVRHAADRDPLTGTFNKRVLMFRLGELLYEAGSTGRPLAVFLFDLDHFKHYNDAHGHLAGDQVLLLLARLVQENVRSEDMLGRFGGEEFLLILRERTAPQAQTAAENIRRLIAQYGFPHGERQPLGSLTISGGVAAFPHHGRDSSALLRAADTALYRAKERGRNQVEVAGEAGG